MSGAINETKKRHNIQNRENEMGQAGEEKENELTETNSFFEKYMKTDISTAITDEI